MIIESSLGINKFEKKSAAFEEISHFIGLDWWNEIKRIHNNDLW